jgi:hypothetical protein
MNAAINAGDAAHVAIASSNNFPLGTILQASLFATATVPYGGTISGGSLRLMGNSFNRSESGLLTVNPVNYINAGLIGTWMNISGITLSISGSNNTSGYCAGPWIRVG